MASPYEKLISISNEKGMILLTKEKEYGHWSQPPYFECPECEKKFTIAFHSIKRRSTNKCPSCARSEVAKKQLKKSLSKKRIKEVFEEKEIKFVRIEDDRVIYECKQCHQEDSARTGYNVMKMVGICHSCQMKSHYAIDKSGKYDEIKRMVKKDGYKLLTTEEEFESKYTRLRIRDKEGKEHKVPLKTYMDTGAIEKERKPMKDRIYQDFVDKGFTPLELTYRNRNQLIPVRCKCGNETKIRYGNLVRNKTGCRKCSDVSRRVSWNRVEDAAKRDGHILVTTKEEYTSNEQHVEFICSCCSDSLASGDVPICTLHAKIFIKGSGCPDCIDKNRRETIMEKYGCENPFQAEECKEKMKKTWMSKYGVDHPHKFKEIKDKAVQTNREKYGVAAAFILDKWMEKAQKVIKEKYGGYHLHSDNFKKVMMERYGVEHPLHDRELLEKNMKATFRLKEHKLPSGNIVHVQGYEPFAIDDLLKEYEEENIWIGPEVPTINYKFEGKKRVYHPDAYIYGEDICVEVKSEYTWKAMEEKNIAKIDACLDEGYKVLLLIYDNKGNLLKREFCDPVV